MTGYYAQTTLLTQSGVSADYQSNVFAVAAPGGLDATTAGDWRDAIKAFYDACYNNGATRGLAQNNHLVKFYDIDGAAPNYPLYELTFNLAVNPGVSDMPQEVALCISYANITENTVPRARRRGRIYISGWSESANTNGRPGQTQREAVANAYADYALEVTDIANFTAGVWSRRDGEVYPIEEVWVDDEWDTQRRRGGRPTTRYTVGI
jgi:hypothetical protein